MSMISTSSILRSGFNSRKLDELFNWLNTHVALRYCETIEEYEDLKNSLQTVVKRLNKVHGGKPLDVSFNEPTVRFPSGEISINRGQSSGLFIIYMYIQRRYQPWEGGAK